MDLNPENPGEDKSIPMSNGTILRKDQMDKAISSIEGQPNSRFRNREPDGELRSFARCAISGNDAILCFNHALCDS